MALHIQRTDSTNRSLPRVVVIERTTSEQLSARIQEVYESVAKALLTCWLTIQYYIESFMSPGVSDAKALFKDGTFIGPTQNMGRLEDISKYVHMQQNPNEEYSLKTKTITGFGNRFGLTTKKTEEVYVRYSPFGSGKCLGSSIHFSEACLKTKGGLTPENIKKTAKEFEDGVPLKGVTYQNIYELFSSTSALPKMCEDLLSFLRNYPNLQNYPNAERRKSLYYETTLGDWRTLYGPKTSTIIEAAKAFLDEEVRPKGGLLTYIQTYLKDIKKLHLNKEHYATVRKSAEEYEQKEELLDLSRDRATCRLASLNIEEVIYHDTTPQVVAQGLSSLNSGAYIFTIPVYLLGYQIGLHALSLIIDDSRNYYFLDPNHGIGAATEKQSSAMFNRIYQSYGNYSEPLFELYRVGQYQSKAESP